MLEFSDKPYRYFPPRRVAPVACLLRWFNRAIRLPRTCRIASVETSGEQDIPGTRLIFTPNHPTHSDAEIFTEAMRQVGRVTRYMAAYDIFLRGRLPRWAMQLSGTFSVDREGSDPRAMAQAKEIILAGHHSLTVFPEGNVYLQNDQVTPFHEGAAMLGLRSARDLARRDATLHVIPVSIKTTYRGDVREPVMDLLEKLARAVQVDLRGDPLERLRAVGLAALRRNLRYRGLDCPDGDDLPEIIQASADAVLRRLEEKMDLPERRSDSLIDRVRRARRVIHQVRLDPEREADHAAATVWADEAMVAFRILSYRGDYVASHPTVDRFAETVEKLGEDVYSRMLRPVGSRTAFVRFGEPIDLGDYLESFRKKARRATRKLTDRMETAVQDGLDRINAANPHPGGGPF
jgi:1-acyl-sn-glycerol-3-phosphate acyltransferase